MFAKVRRWWQAGVVATLLAFAPMAALAQSNFDRPGGDYLRLPVPSGDPAACALQCERDLRCRAWSFVYPIWRAGPPACWLKNVVTPRTEDSCCVSGVRGAGVIEQRSSAIEMSTDRFGGDLGLAEMASDDTAEDCRAACNDEKRCRAWTYARPGYMGRGPRCFLKDQIKPPRRKPGFTSGVVR